MHKANFLKQRKRNIRNVEDCCDEKAQTYKLRSNHLHAIHLPSSPCLSCPRNLTRCKKYCVSGIEGNAHLGRLSRLNDTIVAMITLFIVADEAKGYNVTVAIVRTYVSEDRREKTSP